MLLRTTVVGLAARVARCINAVAGRGPFMSFPPLTGILGFTYMLARLSFAGLDDLNQMNALKVLLATLINGVASVIFLFGAVDWKIAAIMAVASIAGGFWGMVAARKVSQPVLRGFILVTGITLT